MTMSWPKFTFRLRFYLDSGLRATLHWKAVFQRRKRQSNAAPRRIISARGKNL